MTALRRRLLVIAAILLAGGWQGWSIQVHANEAAPLAEDPVVEKRLVSISEELRCLVCQNESLAGSRAELAQDLRREIRTMIKQDKTDAEIMDFMVSRYGDFVRYRPPMNASTLLLWFGPFLLLLGALAGLVIFLRRRGRNAEVAAEATLTPEQRRTAEALLGESGTVVDKGERT